jgi:hypothetical protein
MRRKEAVVLWYHRPRIILWPRKQIISIRVDGVVYNVEPKHSVNSVLDIISAYIIFFPALLFFAFAKRPYFKRKNS